MGLYWVSLHEVAESSRGRLKSRLKAVPVPLVEQLIWMKVVEVLTADMELLREDDEVVGSQL